ncbi:type IV toxin-antitoxin system AbiEi family antitoxin domain-containing protein [Phytoactinopolyspora mesophila]|nr:type IV toxin-antitoxin system AbiEi family antitoxin [Phytoactinopolyspora mesophila]
MTVPSRSLSKGMARIVAELELRQPTLVTVEELTELAQEVGLRTPAKVLAARLRATGWLLPTAQRGVYEFAPGSHAGPYGHGDPFIDLRASLRTGHQPITVALQSALWLHGLAERAPDRHEVAVPAGTTVSDAIRDRMRVVRFSPRLPPADVERLPVHQPPTILVHLATKPGDIRGWHTFAEALPELVSRSSAEDLNRELHQRPSAARARLAYLLSGVAPQIADQLQPTRPPTVTWFGASRTTRRFDKRFNIADDLLPFDPRTISEAA